MMNETGGTGGGGRWMMVIRKSPLTAMFAVGAGCSFTAWVLERERGRKREGGREGERERERAKHHFKFRMY